MGPATRHPPTDADTSPYDSSTSLPSPPATPGARPRALGPHIDDLLDAEEDAAPSSPSPPASPPHRPRPHSTSSSAAAANAAAGLSSPSDDGLSPSARRARARARDADVGVDVDTQLDDDEVDDDDDGDEQVIVHGRDDDIDDCFDSDEQRVDVESLASSAPDDSAPTSPAVPPFAPARPAAPRPAASTSASASSSGRPSVSLLSRASHTFYKAFRKTMGAGPTTTSSGNASAISSVTSASDPGDSGKTRGKTRSAAGSSASSAGSNGSASAPVPASATASKPSPDALAATERHDRLTRLIDAQLAALAGARTGFVDLAPLRPLAEQTAAALARDARPLLRDAGELEGRVRALEREAATRQADADAETLRKERVLIDAKVALAEAMGDVERLRGELAAAKRELAQPSRLRRGVQKQARDTRELIRRRREQRAAAEGHVAERKLGLARERAELERLEEGVRDVEGDWA